MKLHKFAGLVCAKYVDHSFHNVVSKAVQRKLDCLFHWMDRHKPVDPRKAQSWVDKLAVCERSWAEEAQHSQAQQQHGWNHMKTGDKGDWPSGP